MENRSQTRDESARFYTVLADRRRRRLLAYLHEREDDVVPIVDVIDHLTGDDADSVAGLDADDEALSLYHTHLPMLEEAGLIEYDVRGRTVRYRGDEAAERAIERVAAEG